MNVETTVTDNYPWHLDDLPAPAIRVESPVTRIIRVPVPPAMPEGAVLYRYYIESRAHFGRTEKDLGRAVDEWLARGTDSTLTIEAEHYTPCSDACRLAMYNGEVEHDHGCEGGSLIFRSVYDPTRQTWGPWKVD